jgi:hypothetical protein
MEEWAVAQGVSSVDVFTDENGGAVDVGAVKTAIKTIVDSGTVEQLVIYFAGHGVNNGYREYWLLSDAPADTQAAVNVSASETLARYSGIPHVVFISDACRTAAQGIRAQAVGGSEVFLNEGGAGDLEQPVDQFFACTLGRAAHEIADPATTTKEYTALYTQTLLDALLGKRTDVLEWAAEGSDQVGYAGRAARHPESRANPRVHAGSVLAGVGSRHRGRMRPGSGRRTWRLLYCPQLRRQSRAPGCL